MYSYSPQALCPLCSASLRLHLFQVHITLEHMRDVLKCVTYLHPIHCEYLSNQYSSSVSIDKSYHDHPINSMTPNHPQQYVTYIVTIVHLMISI